MVLTSVFNIPIDQNLNEFTVKGKNGGEQKIILFRKRIFGQLDYTALDVFRRNNTTLPIVIPTAGRRIPADPAASRGNNFQLLNPTKNDYIYS